MQSDSEFSKKPSLKGETSPKRLGKKLGSSRYQVCEVLEIHEETEKNAINKENPGDNNSSKQETVIPLAAPLSDLHKSFGIGIVLYFHFIKYSIMLLVILFAISGLFNLISNVLHHGCKDASLIQSEPCVPSYYQILTIDNKRNDQTSIDVQMILNLLAVIACIIFLQFMNSRFRKLQMINQNYKITPSLYTLCVFGLDPSMKDSEIKKWIEGVAPNIECDTINRTYKLDRYFKLVKEAIYKQAEKNDEYDNLNIMILEEEQKKIEDQIKEFLRNKESASFIYISLRTPEQAQTILETFSRIPSKGIKNKIFNLFKLCEKEINGKKVIIKKAPEPEDVLWLNQTYNPWENLKRVIITTLIAGLIFFLCVLVVTYINLLDQELTINESDDKTNVSAVLLTFLQTIFILVINLILGKVTSFLAEQEKHNSKTAFYVGIARKACAFTFVNTGLSFILAQILLKTSFHQTGKVRAELKYVFFFGAFQNIFNVTLQNVLFTPLFKIFDPFYLIKYYKQKKAGNRDQEKKPPEYFQAPDLSLPLKYAFVLKSVLIASFFAPGMPLILIPAILELIAFYWADKYILLRRSRQAVHLSSGLNNEIFRYLKEITIMFAIGNILCIYSVKRLGESVPIQMLILGYITLALGILHFILPSRAANEYLLKFHYKGVSEKDKNLKTYDNSNPFNPKANKSNTQAMILDGRQEVKSKELISSALKTIEHEKDLITERPAKNEKERKSNDEELNNILPVFKNLAFDLIKNPSKVRKTLNLTNFQ